MKASEILGTLPKWANATADDIVKSPAWAMPCRLGETACTMRLDANHPADALDVAIMLEDERHVLSLVDSPRFESLHALWATRAEVPEQILLALVERECGPLLQLLENAARRQLKVVGIASDEEAGGERLCARRRLAARARQAEDNRHERGDHDRHDQELDVRESSALLHGNLF